MNLESQVIDSWLYIPQKWLFKKKTKKEMVIYSLIPESGVFLGNTFHMMDFNFVPRYSCGPTVYDHAHLGHAW